MNTLTHVDFRPDGIFGEFRFEGDTEPFCYTLEHAYMQPDGTYLPILRNGTYECARGIHKLKNSIRFQTYEILGLVGHSGILFHAGNFNADSEGCVLLGRAEAIDPTTGQRMVTGSRDKLKAFLARLGGADTFELRVI